MQQYIKQLRVEGGYVLLSDPFDNVEKPCLVKELLSLTKGQKLIKSSHKIAQNTTSTPSFFEQSSHYFEITVTVW
jgi:hypothetical protein